MIKKNSNKCLGLFIAQTCVKSQNQLPFYAIKSELTIHSGVSAGHWTIKVKNFRRLNCCRQAGHSLLLSGPNKRGEQTEQLLTSIENVAARFCFLIQICTEISIAYITRSGIDKEKSSSGSGLFLLSASGHWTSPRATKVAVCNKATQNGRFDKLY